MATTVRPENVGLKGPTGEFWRISGLYGFHPSGNKIENERVWTDLNKWFEEFKTKRVTQDAEMEVPTRTLMEVLDRAKRRPVDRSSPVPIDKINELTLVWGLILIKFRYRGLDMDEDLRELKSRVAVFLDGFQYDLPGTRHIFDPAHNDWRKHETLYRAVRDFNCGEMLDIPVPGPLTR